MVQFFGSPGSKLGVGLMFQSVVEVFLLNDKSICDTMRLHIVLT